MARTQNIQWSWMSLAMSLGAWLGAGAVHAEGPDNINSIFDRMARGEIEGRLALDFDDRL